MKILMPDGVIRMHQGKAPMPSAGTFGDNGYALDKPSPVISYVMRPAPSRQHLGASVADYEKRIIETVTGQKQLSDKEKKQQESFQKYEKIKAEQDADILQAKKAGLYAILGLGGVAMTGLILFMIHKTRVAARP